MGGFNSLLQGGFLGGGLTTCLTALPFLIIAFVFIVLWRRNNQQAGASRRWSSVIGTIGAATVEARTSRSGKSGYNTAHYPEVLYEYQVLGQKYVGQRITFGTPVGYGDPGRAQAIVNRYPRGSQVAVYYNPQNPAEAVLERTAGTSSKAYLWIAIFILIILCVTVVPLLLLLGGLSTFLTGFPFGN